MIRKGLALIVVIGILGVLAVLAVAFVAMAQLERRASAQRVNAARAYLLARSGIEDALARLDLGQDSVYGGEDWDGDGKLSDYEAAQEIYHREVLDSDPCPVRHAMRPSFAAAAGGNPVVLAVEGRDRGYSGLLAGDHAPKGNGYALKAEGGNQGLFINGGDPAAPPGQGYNATLRRMLGHLAKAVDEDEGGIDGKPVSEADGWRLIDARPSEGWKDWDRVRDLALEGSLAKLAALKPFLALHAWADRKVIAPCVSAAMLDPNGTWFDPHTGKSGPAKAYRSWGGMKLDPGRRQAGGLRAPGFERIDGKIVGRAPVDLSWARRERPALIALLGGLQGLYLDETYATPIALGDAVGRLQAAEVTLAWDDGADICHKVTDRILASTSELRTWRQWHDFCDALPDAAVMSAQDHALFLVQAAAASAANPADDATVSYYEAWALGLSGLSPSSTALSLWLRGQVVRDVLKANFNPHGGLNKFNPNRSMWKLVDKGDLLVHSTEFSLLPVGPGPRGISCVGRVLDRRGRLLASLALKALLAASPPLRLTTQKEFVSEGLGALDVAGDETGFRLPGEAPFIAPSRGSARTWGHALPGLGGGGASLQTFPEPVVDCGLWPSVALSMDPADYDGSIQLATIETAKDAFYGATGPTAQARMTMLARYTGNFDLDLSAAIPEGEAQPPPDPVLRVTPRQNHPDFHQVTSRCTGQPGRQQDAGSPKLEELRYSLLRAGNPGDSKLNTLYPDGCYVELDRVPEYLDKGNVDGCHGVMSFWIKSNHLPPMPNARGNSRGRPILKWSNFNPDSQFFLWGEAAAASLAFSPPPLVCQFEIGHLPDDADREHRFGVDRCLIPHGWELLTLRWDFRAPDKDDTMEMLLNAGRAGRTPSGRGTRDGYPYQTSNAPTLASDITADDPSVWDESRKTWVRGPHRLSLGGRGRPEWETSSVAYYFGAGADATFDEFALYDFGGAGPDGALPADYATTTKASAEVLAAARFPEGRYYKESGYVALGHPQNTAAEWFSAPLNLGTVRIKGLAWTQIVPKELQGTPPSQGGVNGTGIGADLLGGADAGDPGAAILFELVDEAGTGYVVDGRFTDDAWSPVDRTVSRPFRLHAVFQPNLADPDNTPILDPLALDDVTLVYDGGLRVLAWEDGSDG